MGVRKASTESKLNVLEFQDGDRTFFCEAGSSPATPGLMWWWVTITGESQRYAAFRTGESDAPANLRERVLAYYAQMVADRERPREVRSHWGQRRPEKKPSETDGPVVLPE